jgi:hypothetical protein
MEEENFKASRKGHKSLLLCVSVCVSLVFFLGTPNFDIYGLSTYLGLAETARAEDVFRIEFAQPILGISAENIRLQPQIVFSYSLTENGKVLAITPFADYDKNREYHVNLTGLSTASGPLPEKDHIFSKNEKGEMVDKSYTLELPDAGADVYEEMKLAESRYLPPESSRVKIDYHPQPFYSQGKYIDVSIAKQVMTLFEDGKEKDQFLVSTGKYGMPTPTGEYKVQRKEEKHWSYTYKLWMPYSMNFTGGYYIHELPFWPNGYHEGENHLGRRVSHGCVRLGIGPAKYVFDWAEIGTSIYIHK